MPDLVLCDYSVWMEYAKTGAWADLSPYIGEQYPDLMKYVGDDWVYMTVDGGVYGVPNEAEGFLQPCNLDSSGLAGQAGSGAAQDAG